MGTAITSIDAPVTHDLTHRCTVLSGLGLVLAAAPAFGQAQATATAIEIWKSPECGCCRGWITHLERHGFIAAQVHDEGNTAARKSLGMPLAFGWCHTARIGG